MDGGAGTNTFKYGSASESTLTFSDGKMSGFDMINNWDGGTDNVFSLGRTLFGSLSGVLKTATNGGATFAVNDSTGNDAPDTLAALIDDGDGFFETGGVPRTDGGLGNTPVVKHSIAIVSEDMEEVVAVPDDPNTPEDETVEAREAVNRTWIFIDVDGDGDYTAGTDMAIALTGDHTIDSGDFGA